jgi:hypothetical protein
MHSEEKSMRAKKAHDAKIRARTNRWGSSPESKPVMYQLGLKPLPQVPPKTTMRMKKVGEKRGAPACKSQMSFLQFSRSFSLVAVPRVPRRSSDPRQ